MALLTIRNLDDDVKEGLRVRAARHKRSMEAEVRAILKEVVKRAPIKEVNFAAWVRKRFRGLEVELDIPPRERSRPPPDFG